MKIKDYAGRVQEITHEEAVRRAVGPGEYDRSGAVETVSDSLAVLVSIVGRLVTRLNLTDEQVLEVTGLGDTLVKEKKK